MDITSRQKGILERLLGGKGYVTVDDITKSLSVSPRTVYREIPEIESILREYCLTLRTVSKKGMIVEGEPEQFRALRQALSGADKVDIVDQEARSDYILLYLLHENDYVKAEAISIDHRTSTATVRSDLDKIAEKLKNYELRMVRQKGQGMLVTGPHVEKSHLMTDILLCRVDETAIYRWLDTGETGADPFLLRVAKYGYEPFARRTHRAVREVFSRAAMRTRDYLELVLLLSFLNFYHGTEKQYHRRMKTQLEDRKLSRQYTAALRCLEKEFGTTYTEAEQSYVQWVMNVSCDRTGDGHDTPGGVTTIRSQTISEDAVALIDYVEERTGINFHQDRELREGFLAHLDKALTRVRSRMQITNPVLGDIREKYDDLYRIVRDGMKRVFPDDYFPDDEIGYLVLYFALSIDKLAKKLFRVLVVCSGGMGSSKMLAHSLENAIPEISVVKTTSIVALDKENLRDYDLVLSTIPLYLDDDIYLRVSPMLHKNEVLLIKEKIQRHKHSMLRRIDDEERAAHGCSKAESAAVLGRIARISGILEGIVTRFGLFLLSVGEHPREDLQQILGSTAQTAAIRDNQFLLPGTRVAYYEASDACFAEPVICAAKYETAGRLPGDEPEFYQACVFVAYPAELDAETEALLRDLIARMIEDADFVRSIERTDADFAGQWLGYQARKCLEDRLK